MATASPKTDQPASIEEDRLLQALGVDVVEEAVHLTRRRGAPAVVADVFEAVPEEGRWGTALLADGNVGISGDPTHLLRRVRELLRPEGRVVVEVSADAALQAGAYRHPLRFVRLRLDLRAPDLAEP